MENYHETWGLFFLTIIFVFLLDMIWLGLIAKNIYAHNIGTLLRKSGESMTPIWWAAAVVYVCITLGIPYFVLPNANGNYMLVMVISRLLFRAKNFLHDN